MTVAAHPQVSSKKIVLVIGDVSVTCLLRKKLVGCAVFLILVQKKGSYTWIHKDTAALSTWMHAVHVKKNEYLTLKQKQRNIANPKQDAGTKQSCVTLKTNPPT